MKTRLKRVRAVVVAVLAVLVLVGFGYFLATEGLERADRWASVVGAFVALVALGLTLRSMVGPPADPAPRDAGGRTIIAFDNTDVLIGDGSTQINHFDDVRGDR